MPNQSIRKRDGRGRLLAHQQHQGDGDTAVLKLDQHDGQRRASALVTSGKRVIMVVKGRKWGGTHWGVQEFGKQWYSYGERTPLGWLVAPTYDMTSAVERKFLQIWGPIVVEHKAQKRAYILPPSKSTAPYPIRVEIKSADRQDTLRGPTVGPRLLDEPAECTEETFDLLRLVSLDSPGSMLFLTGTPKGYVNWIYKRIWIPYEQGSATIAVYKGKSEENCREHSGGWVNHDELAMLAADLPEHLRRQELEAEFVDFKGLVYAMFNCQRDVVADVPEGTVFVKKIVGMDFGLRHPFASLLLAKDTNGVWWAIDELHGSDKGLDVWGLRLKEWADRYDVESSWADPSGAEERLQLSRMGVYTRDAYNAVDPGIAYVQSLMEKGRFKVVKSRCPMLLNDLQRYQWDDKKSKPVKMWDDCADALRYALYSNFLIYESLERPLTQLPQPTFDSRGARTYSSDDLDYLGKEWKKREKTQTGKSPWPEWYTEDWHR